MHKGNLQHIEQYALLCATPVSQGVVQIFQWSFLTEYKYTYCTRAHCKIRRVCSGRWSDTMVHCCVRQDCGSGSRLRPRFHPPASSCPPTCADAETAFPSAGTSYHWRWSIGLLETPPRSCSVYTIDL